MDRLDRPLSESDVALILGRATELQQRSGESAGTDGLRLETLREIAAEIGVDPRFVDQAAASVLRAPESRGEALMGGAAREHAGTFFAEPLSEEEIRRLVDRLRAVVRHQGRVTTSLGSTEWTAAGTTSLAVTITPRGEGTEVQVIGDRSQMVAPVLALPAVAGLAVGAIVVGGLDPGVPETLAILGGGVTAGLGVGRAVWAASTRSFRRRMEEVHEEIRRFMERKGSR